MKNNKVLNFVISILFIFSFVNFGINIYFFATKSESDCGIFHKVSNYVVELMASSDDIGVSFGSGVVVKNDGTIITNAHVITYKKSGEYFVFDDIKVRFCDSEEYEYVTVKSYDNELDIAVLKIEKEQKIKSIKIGNDNKLDTGDKVYAIGNMSNYGISMSVGSVSIAHVNVAYNGTVRNVIQCDLTISDGNSGGALVNKAGELVGMTTFRLKDNSNNIIYGISYCIPINVIMEYIKNN